MSAQPPPSERPTGPPSGPLSGPTQQGPTPPPSGPPGPPSGGGPAGGSGAGAGGGAGGPGGGGGADRPWWRSIPTVAGISVAVVAAVVLAVVLTRPDGGSGSGGEVFLQAAGTSGPDPYTPSTSRDGTAADPAPAQPTASDAAANEISSVPGSDPGLYGGTRKIASCDVEQQITYLQKDPAKNEAFAATLDIEPNTVPAYLRSLTALTLQRDTRVTNHGYKNGASTPYQAVLQAGTKVLVDDHAEPRVRCACGNPLLPPVKQKGSVKRVGTPWAGYRPGNEVIVERTVEVVKVFVVYDPDSGAWFARKPGDKGADDKKTTPPVHPPTPGVTTHKPCPPGGGGTPAPNSSAPCPPTTPSPKPPPSPKSPLTSPPSSPPSSPPTSKPVQPLQPDEESPATDSPGPASPADSSASGPSGPESLSSSPPL